MKSLNSKWIKLFEVVLFNVIICLTSSVSIVFVKKLSPAVKLKITLEEWLWK